MGKKYLKMNAVLSRKSSTILKKLKLNYLFKLI